MPNSDMFAVLCMLAVFGLFVGIGFGHTIIDWIKWVYRKGSPQTRKRKRREDYPPGA